VPAMVVLAGVLLAHASGLSTASELLRDPLASAGAPFYLGFVSFLGGLLWAGAAACCLLAANVLRRAGDPDDLAGFLTGAAVVNIVLGLDDVFQIHEALLVRVVGVPEIVTYPVYAVALAMWAWRVRSNFWRRPNWALLASAAALLAMSRVLDVVEIVGVSDRLLYLVEELFKYLGLYGWCVYWFLYTRRALLRLLRRSPARPVYADADETP
jgi:hypothetical protein